jgi:hypothetical protein
MKPCGEAMPFRRFDAGWMSANGTRGIHSFQGTVTEKKLACASLVNFIRNVSAAVQHKMLALPGLEKSL